MSAQSLLLFVRPLLRVCGNRFSQRRVWACVLCGLLAAVWMSPAPCFAKKQKSPTTKTVTGQILDKSENGLGGAEVTLKDLQTGKVVAVYAEQNGQYQFTDLDPHHDYELHANYKGAGSETRQVTSFDTRWKVVINLTIPPPASQ